MSHNNVRCHLCGIVAVGQPLWAGQQCIDGIIDIEDAVEVALGGCAQVTPV